MGAEKMPRGGAVAVVNLSFKEAMFAGAVSRSLAQTIMQPANVVKTLLQGRGTSAQLSNLSFKLLTRGAGAQFVMSLPHGAFNFATLEVGAGPRSCCTVALPIGLSVCPCTTAVPPYRTIDGRVVCWAVQCVCTLL